MGRPLCCLELNTSLKFFFFVPVLLLSKLALIDSMLLKTFGTQIPPLSSGRNTISLQKCAKQSPPARISMQKCATKAICNLFQKITQGTDWVKKGIEVSISIGKMIIDDAPGNRGDIYAGLGRGRCNAASTVFLQKNLMCRPICKKYVSLSQFDGSRLTG